MPSRKAGQRLLKRIKQILRENDPTGTVTEANRDEWDGIACWIASLALRDDSASLTDELERIFREYVGTRKRVPPSIECLIRQAMSEYP